MAQVFLFIRIGNSNMFSVSDKIEELNITK